MVSLNGVALKFLKETIISFDVCKLIVRQRSDGSSSSGIPQLQAASTKEWIADPVVSWEEAAFLTLFK